MTPLEKALAEKARRAKAQSKTPASTSHTKVDPNKVDPYNRDFLEAMKKKGYSEAQAAEMLPAYLMDQSTGKPKNEEFTRSVDQMQGLRPGKKNTWGKYDWSGDEYMSDFSRRHAWYLKDHPNFNPEDPAQVTDFQNSYNKKAQAFGLPEYFGQEGGKNKFKVDHKFGQNTYSAPSLNLLDKPPVKDEPVAEVAKTPVVPAAGPLVAGPDISDPTQAEHLIPPLRDSGRAPWWLQDIIKTGHAAGNLARVKKYNPWQASKDTFLTDALYKDPTRELAANSEQANQAYNALAQFTGPQSLAANMSQIQGKALANSADINARYQNDNVGISNMASAQNTAILNDAAQQKAFSDTSLWDKYQIMNQQFDNSKSQARDALVSQYVQGITNKNYTANLNMQNPQFAVDPSVGGLQRFRNPRNLTGANPQEQPTITSIAAGLMKDNDYYREHPDKAYEHGMKILGHGTVPENPYLNPGNTYP